MDTLAVNEANLIQNFIDSANVIIYLKDDQGRFLMVNRRVAEMLKVSKEEVIGKTDYDFFPKEEVDKFRANDRKVAEAGTPMTFKNTVSFPDGQHTVIDHKFPVSNIEGSPNAVGGIVIDITESE
jgi:PAS domain S-box-containing protein